MRREIAAADRQFVVRRAASAWRKAGEVDAAAEAAIAALYADDRVRTSRIFRILFFVFAWFGFSSAYGFGLVFLSAAGLDWNDTAAFAGVNMLAGVAVLAATEVLTAFPDRFSAHWNDGMRAKLGLVDQVDGDAAMFDDLLEALHDHGADFTGFLALLSFASSRADR